MSQRYIIEKTNSGNPRILEQTEDGAYMPIGFGAGENSLAALMSLIRAANDANEIANFTDKIA